MATRKPKIKLTKFDPANYLKTEKDMALYLDACIQEGGDDAAFITAALGDIARARGMSASRRKDQNDARGPLQGAGQERQPVIRSSSQDHPCHGAGVPRLHRSGDAIWCDAPCPAARGQSRPFPFPPVQQ